MATNAIWRKRRMWLLYFPAYYIAHYRHHICTTSLKTFHIHLFQKSALLHSMHSENMLWTPPSWVFHCSSLLSNNVYVTSPCIPAIWIPFALVIQIRQLLRHVSVAGKSTSPLKALTLPSDWFSEAAEGHCTLYFSLHFQPNSHIICLTLFIKPLFWCVWIHKYIHIHVYWTIHALPD